MLKNIILKPIWSLEFFVMPQLPIWIYYSIKARSFTFFSALNPRINLGGLLNYSKYSVMQHIDEALLPKTVLLKANESNISIVEHLFETTKFSFPVILKPDIGERGKGVLKIYDIETLTEHISKNKSLDLILQEYISFPIEIGILYQRHPDDDKGTISSFAIKEYAIIKGNGKSSIKELIKQRGIPLIKVDQTGFNFDSILDLHEELILNEIGNKSFGTHFQNVNHLINQNLIDLFDNISKQVPAFYFGRYDIKIESIEKLFAGQGFKILEINGANSQPIHMFDKSITAFKTYCILWENWRTIYLISKANNRNGNQYASASEFYNQAIRHYKARRLKSK